MLQPPPLLAEAVRLTTLARHANLVEAKKYLREMHELLVELAAKEPEPKSSRGGGTGMKARA